MNAKITTARTLGWLVRLAGLGALVLGALLWMDYPGSLLRPHMILGIVTAVSLAVIALLASATGVRLLSTMTGFVWAGATFFVGFNQSALMRGDNHWRIEVVHVVLGIGTIGMAESLVGRIRRRY